MLHAHGLMKNRRHYWTLLLEGNIEEQLKDSCVVNGELFHVPADCGYNRRDAVDALFQDASLIPAALATNNANASIRVTIEWSYKESKLYLSTAKFKTNI